MEQASIVPALHLELLQRSIEPRPEGAGCVICGEVGGGPLPSVAARVASGVMDGGGEVMGDERLGRARCRVMRGNWIRWLTGGGDVEGHGFALGVDQVVDSGVEGGGGGEGTGAAVPCPAAAFGGVVAGEVEGFACGRFDGGEGLVRGDRCAQHEMDVRGADVNGEQVPTAPGGPGLNGFQDEGPNLGGERVRLLDHGAAHGGLETRVRRPGTGTGKAPFEGSGSGTVKMGAVTGEGEKVKRPTL